MSNIQKTKLSTLEFLKSLYANMHQHSPRAGYSMKHLPNRAVNQLFNLFILNFKFLNYSLSCQPVCVCV